MTRVFLPTVLCSLMLAGCSTASPAEREAARQLDEVARIVLNAVSSIRQSAAHSGLLLLTYFTPQEISVFEDRDGDGRVDGVHDRRVLRYPLDLAGRGLDVRAAEWYACDGQGRVAWSNPEPSPLPIVFTHGTTGARTEIVLDSATFRVSRFEFLPAGR